MMRDQTFISIVVVAGSMAAMACGSADPASSNSEGSLGKNASAVVRKSDGLCPMPQFYVPPPQTGAIKQIGKLMRSWDGLGAARVEAMEATPQAVWFEGGTPSDVQKGVRETMRAAAFQWKVPILVSYNLPFRDCAQYSAGGATDASAYQAWIDGMAKGIGRGQAVVILEPDGLGLIPFNTTIFGVSEWCQPKVTDASGASVPAPGADSATRYALINYAVDSFAKNAPNALVYLDATHSAWLGVGEAASRLERAGVRRARGFFLNASNYQLTSDSTQFGTWISLALATATSAQSWAYDANGNFHYDWLPSQYDPATNYTTVNYSADYAATVTAGIQGFQATAVAGSIPFVIDTSRNAKGPLNTAPYAAAPYLQPASVVTALNSGNWCNPPGAGLGLRPTAHTGVALVDAYVWIKTPGESDGSCNAAGGARGWDYTVYNPWKVADADQANFDPLWGMVDPAAGAWFEEQTLQLVKNADPPILGNMRHR